MAGRPRKIAAAPAAKRADEQTAARLDALALEVRELRELLDAQSELLARAIATNSGPRPQAPPARPAQAVKTPSPAADSYANLVARIRAVIRTVVPAGATVAVLSKGDHDLATIQGRRGWHFPQTPQGLYAGHHPGDGEEAVSHLEDLRRKGAGFLVIPATSFWWFEHYPEFADHMLSRYRMVLRREDTCWIFDLSLPEKRQ